MLDGDKWLFLLLFCGILIAGVAILTQQRESLAYDAALAEMRVEYDALREKMRVDHNTLSNKLRKEWRFSRNMLRAEMRSAYNALRTAVLGVEPTRVECAFPIPQLSSMSKVSTGFSCICGNTGWNCGFG